MDDFDGEARCSFSARVNAAMSTRARAITNGPMVLQPYVLYAVEMTFFVS